PIYRGLQHSSGLGVFVISSLCVVLVAVSSVCSAPSITMTCDRVFQLPMASKGPHWEMASANCQASSLPPPPHFSPMARASGIVSGVSMPLTIHVPRSTRLSTCDLSHSSFSTASFGSLPRLGSFSSSKTGVYEGCFHLYIIRQLASQQVAELRCWIIVTGG